MGRGWDNLVIATPPQYVNLFYLSNISFLKFKPCLSFYSLSSSLPPSLPSSSFRCLALSCQTEKWQARQRSSARGDGQERMEATRHTHARMHACTHINKCEVCFSQHLPIWARFATLNTHTHTQMHEFSP